MFTKTLFLIISLEYLVNNCFASSPSILIEPNLENTFLLEKDAKRNIIIEFKEQTSTILDNIDLSAIRTEEESKVFHQLYQDELQLMALESQMTVHNFLLDKQKNHESFWLTNQMFVSDADEQLVKELVGLENVALIREEKMFSILKPIDEGEVIEGRPEVSGTAVEWNIEKIHANDLWAKANGTGCVVGVIDTGVLSTHEAFKSNMVIAWKDAISGKDKPYDDNGHGTHCTGTIAGINGIGVAPGVRTVHCKACNSKGSCPESAITTCCQFMTEQKPNVVSNSWGGPSGDASYSSVIEGWKALKMFSVFAAGNSGPSCKTIGSPADYASIGCSVGATTNSDSLADFSSRGTCQNGIVGPTVCAPGKDIRSAWKDSKTSYKSISGTSMATPHVAGMYALLHSINPKITFEQARESLVHSCSSTGLVEVTACGGTPHTQFPNNMYGNGRIDCLKGAQVLERLNAKGEFIN